MKLFLCPVLCLLLVNFQIHPSASAGINEIFKGLSCTEDKEVECTFGGLQELGCCSQLWEESKSCEEEDTTKCENEGDFHCVNVGGWTQTHRTDFDKSILKEDAVPRKYAIGDSITECRRSDYAPPELDTFHLGDRSTLSLLPKTLLGRPCDPKLYHFHKIREMWEHYLKCAFDTLDKETFSENSTLAPLYKIVSLSYYHPPIFERVCLASSEMLECLYDSTEKTTAHCECLQFPKMKDNGFTFKQTSHGGKICGQIEGYPCTHNIMPDALIKNNCAVKTPVGQVRPQILNCEPDAACNNLLEKDRLCPVTQMCKCQCVEGRQCNPIKTNEGTRAISKCPSFYSKLFILFHFLIGFSIKSLP